MMKMDLVEKAHITSNVLARMGKNGYISLESLEKICLALDCSFDNVIEIVKDPVDKEEKK
jgi:DNA-binding Xre family transcriptional regulator